jgi:hypothetical protein
MKLWEFDKYVEMNLGNLPLDLLDSNFSIIHPKTREDVIPVYERCKYCKRITKVVGERTDFKNFGWEQVTPRIGDFTWGLGGEPLIIKDWVIEQLRENGVGGFEIFEMHLDHHPLLHLSQAETGMVSFSRFQVSGEKIKANLEMSSFWFEKCEHCGNRTKGGAEGYEEIVRNYDKHTQIYTVSRKPREQGKGAFIEQSRIHPMNFFKIKEFLGTIIVADPLKEFLQKQKYTNIDFFEVGETY